MNSDDVKREAVAFAESLLKEPSDQRIEMAWQRAFQRLPTPSELDNAGSFLTEYAQHADEAQAWTALCRSLMTSHEFFYVD